MAPNARTLGPLLVLVLLTTPLAGMASASSDGDQADGPGADADRAPARAWQDLKAALSAQDAGQARHVYESQLAPHSEAFPEAAAAIEAGISLVENASGPDDPDAIVGDQQADKATYALAFANLEAAAQADDLDAVEHWFELLATKFSSADALVESKAAFGNLTAETLDDAVGLLEDEYRALITSNVYHETEETPELIEAGEQATAIKEAAEARWYFLSIENAVADTLGEDTAGELRAELAELIAMARADRLDGAAGEAEEILGILATFALASAPQEKAEAFSAYQQAISDGDVAQARSIYDEAFSEPTEEYASAAHDRVQQAFDDLEDALAAQDDAEVAVQAQILKKSVLESAHTVAFHELTEEEIDEGLEHFAVVASKFGWTTQPNDGALAVGHIAADGSVDDEVLDRAKRGVAAKFLEKVREETEEVFIHWNDTATAREKAIEGVLYYRPASDHVINMLGQAPADELLEEVEKLYDATTAQDREAADLAASEVIKLLDQIEAGGEEVTELDSLLSDLRGKISFVGEEYRGYVEAREAGDQGEADTELGEAKAFARAARNKVDENTQMLNEGDPEAADELASTLDTLIERVDADAPLSEVEGIVEDALAQLEALKQGAVAGTVSVRLGPAQPSEGHLVVPITLAGLPEDGVAYQANLGYPTETLRATEVTSDLEVAASTVDEESGEIRFNGAATAAPTGPVARITFELLDMEASTAELSLTVTELADASGDPLGIDTVEGEQLDLQAAGTDVGEQGNTSAGPAATPSAGAWLVLALIGLGAAFSARRRT